MLQLARALFERIAEQGRAGKPLEICGLLAGHGGEAASVLEIYPIDSLDRSELTYSMDPLQYLTAEKAAKAAGLELVGIYHTHPATQPYPSVTDVAQAHWGDTDDLNFPGFSYLIVSLRDPANPEPRSFKIQGRRIPEDILEEDVAITP